MDKTQNYIVMEKFKMIWHYQFIREQEDGRKMYYLLISYMLMNIIFLFLGVCFEENVLRKTEAAAEGFCLLGATSSHVVFFICRKDVFYLVSVLQKHYDQHKHIREDLNIISTCYTEGNTILKMFLIPIISCWTAFSFKPVILFLIEYLSTGEGTVLLPLVAMYPWGTKGIFFLLSYFLQISALGIVGSMATSNATSPVFFCMAIVARMKLAQERFKEITEDCKTDSLTRLKAAIESHQEALDLVILVQNAEGLKYFSQVSTSAAAASLCLLRISQAKADELQVVLVFITLFSCVLFQMLLVCYYGQKVINEGDKLYEEICNVPWYAQSKPFKKCFIFCLMRAAKIAKLTAYGFAVVSLETFNAVMTSAFSYMTCLQTVSE